MKKAREKITILCSDIQKLPFLPRFLPNSFFSEPGPSNWIVHGEWPLRCPGVPAFPPGNTQPGLRASKKDISKVEAGGHFHFLDL